MIARRFDIRYISSSSCRIFRPTRMLLNFFPWGQKSGPTLPPEALQWNNYNGSTHTLPLHKELSEPVKPVQYRDELRLQCKHCHFRWTYDVLHVYCPAVLGHCRREMRMHPVWIWGYQQPLNHTRYVKIPPKYGYQDERTGLWFGDERSRRVTNKERRRTGMTTVVMRGQKEARGINWKVAGVGSFSKRWETRWPWPT